MCVRYQGETSVEQLIPGGGPQGGLLTVIFFDLQVNLAGFPCKLETWVPQIQPGPEPIGPLPLCHQSDLTLKKKYVDDLTMLEAIQLKIKLIPAPPVHGPCNLHEQSGLVLPP